MKDISPVICDRCGWEIDPDWCHCGNKKDGHEFEYGHSFIPLGCTCGYVNSDQMRNEEYFKAKAKAVQEKS